MRFFRSFVPRHLLAGAAMGMAAASPSAASSLPLGLRATTERPLVMAQAARDNANSGDRAQPDELREEKKKKHKSAGKAGERGKAAAQPEKPPSVRRADQKPAGKPEGWNGNGERKPRARSNNAQEAEKENEAPRPERLTAPRPESAAPAGRQTESAPSQIRPPNGKRKAPGGQQEPARPVPRTVTVPKSGQTTPERAQTGGPPHEDKPARAGESAAEKLRRDIRKQQGRQAPTATETPLPETVTPREQAPLTDSAKESGTVETAPAAKPRGKKPGATGSPPAQRTPQLVVTPQNLPKTDKDAQSPAIRERKIESVEAESGTVVRGESLPVRRFDSGKVVRRSGNRIVVRAESGRLSVLSTDDHDRRLRRHATNVRVEELRGGRLRETIYLRDGSRIVTIYSRDGDILRRSRILPDGREILLVYVPRERWDEFRGPYYDPGRYLPPLVLTIPVWQYIFQDDQASADDYYRFLSLPPVEPVPRLYSVDEVARSARIRDMARRVDLVSVHFDFGSAEISSDEVDALRALAEAMNRLLDENPGEMFLIEGHTDAVGSEEANLILSDRRAEAVAEVFTDYFGIPPENMVTHGYGERYLKIQTPGPERENRRVAVRRITPLVAPMNEQVLR